MHLPLLVQPKSHNHEAAFRDYLKHRQIPEWLIQLYLAISTRYGRKQFVLVVCCACAYVMRTLIVALIRPLKPQTSRLNTGAKSVRDISKGKKEKKKTLGQIYLPDLGVYSDNWWWQCICMQMRDETLGEDKQVRSLCRALSIFIPKRGCIRMG